MGDPLPGQTNPSASRGRSTRWRPWTDELLGPPTRRPTIFGMSSERRRRRSKDPLQALHLQLDACRRAAALDGMVLSDEDGLLLAATGDRDACDEVAARLPLIGRRSPAFEGV